MTVDYRFTAHAGTSRRETRTVYDAVPAIVRVRVESVGDDGFVTATYGDLATAEAAVTASAAALLDRGAAATGAIVTLEWPDGAWHRTTLPLDRETLARDRYTGVVRSRLLREAKFVREAHPDPEVRAWAVELRARLAADRSDPATQAGDRRWRESLAFLPSADAIVPVVEVRIAVGTGVIEDAASAGDADRYPSLASAADAIERIAAGRRPDQVVSMWVSWADGMRFSVWTTVADLAALSPTERRHYLPDQIRGRARFVLTPGYAEQNARSLPRRPLEPQQAWATELLRRLDTAIGADGAARARGGRVSRGRK